MMEEHPEIDMTPKMMEFPPPDGLPPIWHTFVEGEGVTCASCGRWPTHHFHTGVVGSECGCDDCRPVSPVYADAEHMTMEGRIVIPRRSPFRRVGRYFRRSRPR